MTRQNKTQKRMLGIVGSPRRDGNTETLVDAVLRGAEESSVLTEKIILREQKIAPCQACQACWTRGRCVQRDDMADILNTMQHSQVWVLGTPVYWQGPSAQFKLFLDRWFGQGQVVTFPEKRVILTISLGAEEKFSRHLVGMLNGACEHLNIEIVATIVAPNVWDPGKVKEYPEILAEAYRAGKEAFA